MQITSIQNICNTTFGANNVILENIDPTHFQRYNEIQKIAEKNNIDIYITKSDESKYLFKNDLYIIVAKQDLTRDGNGKDKFGLLTHGTSSVLTDKQASAKEVSDKLYETVIESIKSLAKNVEERMGKKPNFLKFFKK